MGRPSTTPADTTPRQHDNLSLNLSRTIQDICAVILPLNLDSDTIMQVHFAEPLRVAPTDSTESVLRRMKELRDGGAVVCVDGKLAGIFTERDALRVLAEQSDLQAPISQFMSSEPASIQSNESVGTAIRSMSRGGYRRLPIIDEANTVVGIVKVSHILHYMVEHFPEFVYNLPPTSKHRMQEREGA